MLDQTVIDDGKRLSVAHAENHHQPTPRSRLHAILLFCFTVRPVHDVGLHANGKDADLAARSFHRAPAIIAVGPVARHPDIQPWPVNRVALEEIVIAIFQRLQTGFHIEKLFHLLIVDEQHVDLPSLNYNNSDDLKRLNAMDWLT